MFDRGLEHTLGTPFWKCKPKDINIHCTNCVYEAYFFQIANFLNNSHQVANESNRTGVASITILGRRPRTESN